MRFAFYFTKVAMRPCSRAIGRHPSTEPRLDKSATMDCRQGNAGIAHVLGLGYKAKTVGIALLAPATFSGGSCGSASPLKNSTGTEELVTGP